MFICVANDVWRVIFLITNGFDLMSSRENKATRSPQNIGFNPYTNQCGECGLEGFALKFKVSVNPRTVVGAISLKSRRGDRVKRKNSIVLPLAASFAYFFPAEEMGF